LAIEIATTITKPTFVGWRVHEGGLCNRCGDSLAPPARAGVSHPMKVYLDKYKYTVYIYGV